MRYYKANVIGINADGIKISENYIIFANSISSAEDKAVILFGLRNHKGIVTSNKVAISNIDGIIS